MPGGSYVGVGVPPEKCASPAHGEGPTKWEGLFRGNNAETEKSLRNDKRHYNPKGKITYQFHEPPWEGSSRPLLEVANINAVSIHTTSVSGVV